MKQRTQDSVLGRIQQPADLRALNPTELDQLASEIRQRIIEVMAVNGGHLASNLGTVELTLALHLAFNAPEDKIIWDVSHQTYPHKLVTGRNDRFDGVRQFQGLSGFSCPSESIYDHFFGGHAGTALSLGLGVATTRDLEAENYHVIPVIGDATLTCGMSFEALNNLPRDMRRFVVILNDNKMSISKNVGAITYILARMLQNPKTSRLYRDMQSLLSRMPMGNSLAQTGDRMADAIKNVESPSCFFEQFGLDYLGPFDGHDTHKLRKVFERVRDCKHPTLIHVHTNKGQGIEKAMENPTTYHGVRPFDKTTYKFLPSKGKHPSFPQVFGEHLAAMAEEDESIVAVTPAMPHGSCLTTFIERHPDRCIDVGIAESHSITFAGGLAYGGQRKVVASIYSSFLQRALDSVFHDVCLQELPVVFAIDRAGISGGDGQMCNGIYDIGFLRSMPNMVICQPRNGHLLKELMSSAFSWKRPTAIRYPNLATDEANAPIRRRALGRGELLIDGEDIALIPLGNMCDVAMELRDKLMEAGWSPSIFDPIFIKP
ncbi:MAG: 1-deoxy-D-xylulose-5-phosphate synthase, partial [Chlamydiia bacterium]|nr:1-deoxy-D-xylulose-5-phosphate synthase [Chlamydiia bacterium]